MVKKYNSIQILRGIAAVFVMLYHATKHYHLKGDVFLNNFFKTGFLGVDIFFVLSGFVISISSASYFRNHDSLGFLKKRFIRIYPSYWIFLLAPLILVYIFFPNFITNKSAFEAVNFIKVFLLAFNHPTLSQVTWTLSFELYFYLLFLFLIINKNFKFVLAGILLLCIFNFFGLLEFSPDLFKKYLFSPLIIEFFFGILIAYLLPRINPNILLLSLFFIASIGLFYYFSILHINGLIGISKHNRFLYLGIPSFLLIFSLVLFEKNNTLKNNTSLILFGESSYVLYLIHSIVLSFGNKYILEGRFVIFTKSLTTIIVCGSIILISILLHIFVEKPMINKLSMFKKKAVVNESL